MTDLQFGTWVSRIIRWLLAILFSFFAFQYPDLWYFYIFSGILFLTGFIPPKRCVESKTNEAGENTTCNL